MPRGERKMNAVCMVKKQSEAYKLLSLQIQGITSKGLQRNNAVIVEFFQEKGKSMFDRITFDSKIMGGCACIRGIRIPVSVIVGQIAHGVSFEEILEGYPDLEKEDMQDGQVVDGNLTITNPFKA